MKLQIDEKGIGGRDESWWYLLFDETDGNFYIEHEWHNSGWDSRVDEGTKKYLLSEYKNTNSNRYEKAVEIIKNRLFSETK